MPGPGERFGDYELLAELGRGGMGIVFKARQISLDRPVALKMILSGLGSSAEEIQRFRLEAEAVARLDHRHIVAIYEVGNHAGRHFFSMKYIAGQSLAQRQSPMPLTRQQQTAACRLMAAIADAVHHAHRAVFCTAI